MPETKHALPYEEFKPLILKLVSASLGADASATVRRFQRNNGTALDGIVVRHDGDDAAPVIYLDGYYESFLNGESPEILAKRILETAGSARESRPETVPGLSDFGNVRDRVVFRLVSAEKNADRLEEVPHVPFLDLAVTFHVLLSLDDGYDTSFMIQNEHMDAWKTDPRELYSLALSNTPRLLGWDMKNLKDVLALLGAPDAEGDKAGDFPLYVLTNKTKVHGASAVLYEGLLPRIADEIGDDLWILPSSVHETLLVPKSACPDALELSLMIREVNKTQVPEEDVLSDHPYLFTRGTRTAAMPDGTSGMAA